MEDETKLQLKQDTRDVVKGVVIELIVVAIVAGLGVLIAAMSKK